MTINLTPPTFQTLLCAIVTFAVAALPAAQATSPHQTDAANQLGNEVIAARWDVADQHLQSLTIHDKINDKRIEITAPFKLIAEDGTKHGINNMQIIRGPKHVTLAADPDAARLAERLPGKAIQARFRSKNGHLRVDWRLLQRKGSHYIREVVTIHAQGQDLHLAKVELLDSKAADAHVVGSVKGSPVVAGQDYLGFEHPMSHARAWSGDVQLWIERELPLRKGTSVRYSAVVGATRPTQLRRDFATYINRERAHPYRPFLHYNSWYDIGYFTPYTQKQALERINTFGKKLVEQRHVKMDSFLFDDGWDDYSGSWNFSKNFPHGFVPLCKAAKKYGAAPGVWLSPWGGYGPPSKKRIANGHKAGYGIVDGRLALSAPKYWKRFHHVVMKLLNEDCINQFKLDGTGNVDSVYPGSRFDSDFAAAIQLIDDIRADKPNTFVNLTTGTWASPFWLRWADSIYRGGYDHNFVGAGSKRQQWITYRDEQTYRNIVEKGPLFPINSLMLHGIIYAQHARGLNADPDNDFAAEVHSYFATGTDLQELYITPDLLSKANWDTLAKAAKWARKNANVLRDTHWIGGDPGRADVYGWATWTPKKAFITFRNPAAKPQLAVLNLDKQLELRPNAVRKFKVHDVWHTGGKNVPTTLDADQLSTLKLAPFQVVTLQLKPVAKD